MDDQNNNQAPDDASDANIETPNAEEAVVEQPQEEVVADAAPETPAEDQNIGESEDPSQAAAQDDTGSENQMKSDTSEDGESVDQTENTEVTDNTDTPISTDKTDATDSTDDPNAKWYVVHTYSGHENKVATALKQRVESEHLEHKIFDVLVPTQDKIEIRSGKKETVKEKIFPGYILVKMVLDDDSWLAVRTTQGVTSFVGMGNKPTPIPDFEVRTIVKFMTQEAAPTFKDVFLVADTVKIIDGPFADFIGKIDAVDKDRGKVKVLVSIFGRETPVELDFLQVQKL